jgi:hypothetical protein
MIKRSTIDRYRACDGMYLTLSTTEKPGSFPVIRGAFSNITFFSRNTRPLFIINHKGYIGMDPWLN